MYHKLYLTILCIFLNKTTNLRSDIGGVQGKPKQQKLLEKDELVRQREREDRKMH